MKIDFDTKFYKEFLTKSQWQLDRRTYTNTTVKLFKKITDNYDEQKH